MIRRVGTTVLVAALSLGSNAAVAGDVQEDLHVSVRLGGAPSAEAGFAAVVSDNTAFALPTERSRAVPETGRLAVGTVGNVGVFLEPSLSATQSGARRLAHVAASGPVQAITDAELGFTGSVSVGVSF